MVEKIFHFAMSADAIKCNKSQQKISNQKFSGKDEAGIEIVEFVKARRRNKS